MPQGLHVFWRYCNEACEYSFKHRSPARIKGMPNSLEMLSFSECFQKKRKLVLAGLDKLPTGIKWVDVIKNSLNIRSSFSELIKALIVY